MKTCPYCGEEILAVAKKCKHCGEWLNNDEEQKEEIVKVPCPICGEMIEEGATQCPHCNESIASEVMQKPVNEEASESDPPQQTRSFFDYYFVEPFIKHFSKFKGRINRKHFWISILLWGIFTLILISLLGLLEGSAGNIIMYVCISWGLLSIIPIYAIVLRRMRDGDSELGSWAWWFYIIPIPYMFYITARKDPAWLCLIPFIILLWWLVKPSDNVMRDDGLAPDEQPQVAFKKFDLIALIVILVCLLVISMIGWRGSSENSKSSDHITMSDEVENFVDESDKVDENTQENVKEAYLDFLSKLDAMGEEQVLGSYFLFDITGDGIPELWIESGTCQADHAISVYTYNNKLAILDAGEEGNASHSGFCRGDDYILQVCGHMGYQAWSKITYSNGTIKSEVIFEEDLNESGKDDYTEPSEPAVESYPFDDTEPVVTMFDHF